MNFIIIFIKADSRCFKHWCLKVPSYINPIALRKAKIVYNLGL